MHTSARFSQSVLQRSVRLGTFVMFLAIAGALGLLAYTNSAIENLQAQEKRELVSRHIDRQAKSLIVDINSMSIWDEAYRELNDKPKLDWVDLNVGAYFANYMHHDVSLVVGSQGQALYGWAGDRRTDARDQARLLASAAELIADLREKEEVLIRQDGAVRAAGIASSVSASGMIQTDRGTYLAAATTVVPETLTTPRRVGRDPIVLSAVKIGGPFLAELQESLGVQGARLEPIGVGTSKTAVLLRDQRGAPLGVLAWSQTFAGLSALRRVAPLVLLGFLAFWAANIVDRKSVV